MIDVTCRKVLVIYTVYSLKREVYIPITEIAGFLVEAPEIEGYIRVLTVRTKIVA